MYSQLLCLFLLVTTINSNYTPQTFSQTHNNTKHSHCSSLPAFVRAPNLGRVYVTLRTLWKWHSKRTVLPNRSPGLTTRFQGSDKLHMLGK